MNDYNEILIALRRIMRATDLHSQKLVRESGLTAPQILVMQAIASEGTPSTSTLARRIVVSQATVTRIIDRLERAGLVERRKSTRDKRVVNVALTPEGEAGRGWRPRRSPCNRSSCGNITSSPTGSSRC